MTFSTSATICFQQMSSIPANFFQFLFQILKSTIKIFFSPITFEMQFATQLEPKRSAFFKAFHFANSKKCNKISLFQPALDPKDWMADFEKAVHNPIGSVWPRYKIHGCNYHHGEANTRWLQSKMLTFLLF